MWCRGIPERACPTDRSYFLILLPTGSTNTRSREPSDVRKTSVMMVSAGIVSYTRWPALSGPPKSCIFSSSRFSTALQECRDIFALSACHHSHSTEGDNFKLQWFLFWQRTTNIQMELTERISVKALLLIAEQNTSASSVAPFSESSTIMTSDFRNAIPHRVAV